METRRAGAPRWRYPSGRFECGLGRNFPPSATAIAYLGSFDEQLDSGGQWSRAAKLFPEAPPDGFVEPEINVINISRRLNLSSEFNDVGDVDVLRPAGSENKRSLEDVAEDVKAFRHLTPDQIANMDRATARTLRCARQLEVRAEWSRKVAQDVLDGQMDVQSAASFPCVGEPGIGDIELNHRFGVDLVKHGVRNFPEVAWVLKCAQPKTTVEAFSLVTRSVRTAIAKEDRYDSSRSYGHSAVAHSTCPYIVNGEGGRCQNRLESHGDTVAPELVASAPTPVSPNSVLRLQRALRQSSRWNPASVSTVFFDVGALTRQQNASPFTCAWCQVLGHSWRNCAVMQEVYDASMSSMVQHRAEDEAAALFGPEAGPPFSTAFSNSSTAAAAAPLAHLENANASVNVPAPATTVSDQRDREAFEASVCPLQVRRTGYSSGLAQQIAERSFKEKASLSGIPRTAERKTPGPKSKAKGSAKLGAPVSPRPAAKGPVPAEPLETLAISAALLKRAELRVHALDLSVESWDIPNRTLSVSVSDISAPDLRRSVERPIERAMAARVWRSRTPNRT